MRIPIIEGYLDENKRQEKTIKSSIVRMLKHMLKCKYQPDYPDKESWRTSILGGQADIWNEFDSPKKNDDKFSGSLYKNYYLKRLNIKPQYELAKIQASNETRLHRSTFPSECEWNKEQLLDIDFISKFIEEYGYGRDEWEH